VVTARSTDGPVQVAGQVLTTRRIGAYHHLTLVAPGVAERTRPGQFVALATGGPDTGLTLRRAFSIYRTSTRGVYGGTVDVVVGVKGAGTAWLAAAPPHTPVDVVGPLGRPFSLPRDAASVTLVGGGYGAAPLFGLAEALASRGCRITFVLGAGSGDRLFGVLDAKRMAASVAVTTDDGSTGTRGRVTDVLPRVMDAARTEVVYACGPMAMLRAVTRVAQQRGVPTQCAVEESMACGIGVCMTCVLPVVGDDGLTRMVRSCTDGPVFAGDRVRWDDVGTVPVGTVGAPVAGGH
jgi:dihydroorotate dehydrogenase electron transfer subunit